MTRRLETRGTWHTAHRVSRAGTARDPRGAPFAGARRLKTHTRRRVSFARMFDKWIASATHPPRRVAAKPPFALLTFASSFASNRVPHAFLTRPTNDTHDLQMGRRNLRRDPRRG